MEHADGIWKMEHYDGIWNMEHAFHAFRKSLWEHRRELKRKQPFEYGRFKRKQTLENSRESSTDKNSRGSRLWRGSRLSRISTCVGPRSRRCPLLTKILKIQSTSHLPWGKLNIEREFWEFLPGRFSMYVLSTITVGIFEKSAMSWIHIASFTRGSYCKFYKRLM